MASELLTLVEVESVLPIVRSAAGTGCAMGFLSWQ